MRVSSRRPRAALILALAVLAGCASDGRSDAPAQPAQAAAYLIEAQALVGMDDVRGAGWTGAGVTVALIDTGIDTTHPDLAGRVVDEACFCGTGCCPGGGVQETGAGSALDDHGHGTHVAGIVASQGTSSPRGGVPDVEIVAVKVLDDNLDFCCMSDVVDALDWIAANHPEVDVVNLSLGASSLYGGDCDVVNSALGIAVDALRAAGTLVVAASGNDGSPSSMRAPACIAAAISVGAVWDADVGAQTQYCSDPTTAADQIACYSNASPTTDLLAPGGAIESTWPGPGTHVQSGTSEAAPIATACIAALRQAAPAATPDAIEAALEQTGVPRLDARNGQTYPRLDCAAALRALVPDAFGDADGGAEEDDAGTLADAGTATPDAGADAAATDAAPVDDRDAAPASDGASEPGPADAAAEADAAVAAEDGGGASGDAAADAGELHARGGDGCACSTARTAAVDPGIVAAIALLAVRRRRPRA